MTRTAQSEFTRLDGIRATLRSKAEKYASYTHPRLFLPDGLTELNAELTHDYQSLGAQSSNHLTNRLMLTLFAPSRPFMRLQLPARELAVLAAQLQMPPADLEQILSEGERNASRELDSVEGMRAQLFEACMNLGVLGNVLLHLPKGGDFGVTGLRDYVIRRTANGGIQQLIVREHSTFDELEDDVQAAYIKACGGRRPHLDAKVCTYRWIKREGKRLKETTWVENIQLKDDAFLGDYPLDDCPWHPLAWNLRRRGHYGTGLVEDYAGDFAALSMLSRAQIEGAILASEFRWLLRAGAQLKVEEFEGSENGAVLAGEEGDLTLVTNSRPGDLQVLRNVNEDYVRRIGQGFLLNSAVTRDAERVTAEEIRQQAVELETGLGGVYSRLAVALQLPVARWLLNRIDFKIKGTKIKLSIVTGLDALSRHGDLAALRSALADIAQLEVIAKSSFARELNFRAIVQEIFSGNGCDAAKYLATPEQQATADAQAAEQQAIEAGTQAAANNMTQGNQ